MGVKMTDGDTTIIAKKLRPKIKFTDKHFENRSIKPEDGPYEVGDAIQRGLRLYVSVRGDYGWRVRYRYPKGPTGKPRVLVLQSGITLGEARFRAAQVMNMLSQGIDPGAKSKADIKAEEEQKQRASLGSFRKVSETFMDLEGKKLRTVRARELLLDRLVYPTLGGQQVDAITKKGMTELLDHIVKNNGERTADIVLAAVNRVLNWHEGRTDDFVNPIRRLKPRRKPIDHTRERSLTDDEVKAAWGASFQLPVYGAVVRFLLLTGCRRSEASDLRWSEIDGDIWTLPASRSKSKRKVKRPLSAAALEVVQSMPRIIDCPYVFPGRGNAPFGMNKPEHHKILLDACPNIEFMGKWVLHDLRRTFVGKLVKLKVPLDVRELLLGHSLPILRRTYEVGVEEYMPAMRDAVNGIAAEIERITGMQKQSAEP
jgi:integrase